LKCIDNQIKVDCILIKVDYKGEKMKKALNREGEELLEYFYGLSAAGRGMALTLTSIAHQAEQNMSNQFKEAKGYPVQSEQSASQSGRGCDRFKFF
jgi:hypothetical protein